MGRSTPRTVFRKQRNHSGGGSFSGRRARRESFISITKVRRPVVGQFHLQLTPLSPQTVTPLELIPYRIIRRDGGAELFVGVDDMEGSVISSAPLIRVLLADFPVVFRDQPVGPAEVARLHGSRARREPKGEHGGAEETRRSDQGSVIILSRHPIPLKSQQSSERCPTIPRS